MSDWDEVFEKGKLHFQEGRRHEALNCFNSAASLGGDCTVYEYRAALHEKLGNTKEALLDAKKAINMAPGKWQSYARAAGLFLFINKYDAAKSMADHALERVDLNDTDRKQKLLSLKDQAQKRQRKAELVKQKEAEKRKVAASKKAYQFGKLPMEIIVSIFEYIVEANPSRVLLIARVCGQWRRIALSAPSLWTTLILTDKRPQKKVELWSRQSRGHIQQLDLGDHWTAVPATFSWSRLTSLRVGQESALAFRTFCVETGYLPALQSLEITFQGRPNNTQYPRRFWHPVFSPTLQHIKLDLSTFSWVGLSHILAQLVSLDVAYPSLDVLEAFLDLLRANSPTIKTLVIRHPFPNIDIFSPKIFLPQLAHLTIHPPQFTGIVTAQLLMLLDIPGLQSLSMTNVAFTWEILDTLKQSHSTLTTICLRSIAFNPLTLIYLLKHATSITTLELTRSSHGNTIIEALADPTYLPGPPTSIPDHSPLPECHESRLMCPQLRHLNLTGCNGLKTGPLVRIVKTRLPVSQGQDTGSVDSAQDVASIETLIVDGCDSIEPDLLPWFRSKVPTFSCVYMSGKAAKYKR